MKPLPASSEVWLAHAGTEKTAASDAPIVRASEAAAVIARSERERRRGWSEEDEGLKVRALYSGRLVPQRAVSDLAPFVKRVHASAAARREIA